PARWTAREHPGRAGRDDLDDGPGAGRPGHHRGIGRARPARVADVRRRHPLYPGVQGRNGWSSACRLEEERRTMTTVMELSNAMAGAVERAARSVFAVHGRRRLPSTG